MEEFLSKLEVKGEAGPYPTIQRGIGRDCPLKKTMGNTGFAASTSRCYWSVGRLTAIVLPRYGQRAWDGCMYLVGMTHLLLSLLASLAC
jgi:hypothetical protein